jgi:hypothetical protein
MVHTGYGNTGYGTYWLWYILVVVHTGYGTYWLWYILVIVHTGYGSYWLWYILVMVHTGYGTYWVWYIRKHNSCILLGDLCSVFSRTIIADVGRVAQSV